MKKVIIGIILTFIFSSSFSQSTFSYYYKTSTGFSPYYGPALMVKCKDGNFIGIAGIGTTVFLLFETDYFGNMLWQKELTISLAGNLWPLQICLLNDSSITVLILTYNINLDFVVMKTDLNGNVTLAKGYNTFFSGNEGSIEAYGLNGMLVNWGKDFFYIDSSGTVVNSKRYNSFDCFEIKSHNNNSYTCWGIKGFPGNYILCNIDSNGTVTNYFNYTIAGESAGGGGASPNNLITKSTNERYYCAYNLYQPSGSPHKMGVFCFNDQYQNIWAKKIELDSSLVPYSINSCADNGCLVAAEFAPSLNYRIPMIIKFDSTGTVNWIKVPADTSNNNWNVFDIYNTINDSASGWFSVLNPAHLTIIHSDSLLNGFCTYSLFTPLISDLIITANSDTDVSVSATAIDNNLNVTLISKNIFRYDACTDSLIDSLTTIVQSFAENNTFQLFPNPTNDFITIHYNLSTPNQTTLSLFNLYGQKLKTILNEKKPVGEHEMKIDMKDLEQGVYFVKMGVGGKEEVRKVVKY